MENYSIQDVISNSNSFSAYENFNEEVKEFYASQSEHKTEE
jgi:hypothetical protein